MKKTLFSILMAFGILFAGCDREPVTRDGDDPTGSGSISVTLKSAAQANGGTRAIGPATETTEAAETAVKNYVVYVFHYNSGALEASAEVGTIESAADLTTTITGLSTASTKRVVVLVNYTTAGLSDFEGYTELQAATINLSTQDSLSVATNGMFMSGEYGIEEGESINRALTLTAGQTTSVTVDVKRAVAKVILNQLTIASNATGFDGFKLTGASIQRAPGTITAIGDGMPASIVYYGGIAGSGTTALLTLDMLLQAYTLPNDYAIGNPVNPNAYFFTSPNDDVNNMSTLLTLYGTLANTSTAYYTFPINVVMVGEDEATGKGIQRNWIYLLNITLRNINLGADDPNVVNGTGNLEVVVEMVDWEGPLTHDMEW